MTRYARAVARDGRGIAAQVNRLRDSFRDNEAALLGSAQEKVELLSRTFSDSLTPHGAGDHDDGGGDTRKHQIPHRLRKPHRRTFSRAGSIPRSAGLPDINAKIGNIEKGIENFELALQETRSQSLAETRSDIATSIPRSNALKSTLSDLENSVFADIKGQIRRHLARDRGSITEFSSQPRSLLEKVETDIGKVYGKLRGVENTIDDSKSKLIASFAEEVAENTDRDRQPEHPLTSPKRTR